MPLDRATAHAGIAKAKEDIIFWERVLRTLNESDDPEGLPTVRRYGEVKAAVLSALPDVREEAIAIPSIKDRMSAEGFVFQTKNPSLSIQEAIRSLENEGKAVRVGSLGRAITWAKT